MNRNNKLIFCGKSSCFMYFIIILLDFQLIQVDYFYLFCIKLDRNVVFCLAGKWPAAV